MYKIYITYSFFNNPRVIQFHKNYKKKGEIIIRRNLLYLGRVNVLYVCILLQMNLFICNMTWKYTLYTPQKTLNITLLLSHCKYRKKSLQFQRQEKKSFLRNLQRFLQRNSPQIYLTKDSEIRSLN